MDQRRPDGMQHRTELLQQRIVKELECLENELSMWSCSTMFGDAQRKAILKRAYLIGFARLALDMSKMDEVLHWLENLPVKQTASFS
jgi:hypothetical protein